MKYYLVYKKLAPYGWSFDLNIIKAFLNQRVESYNWIKSSKDEIEKVFNCNSNLNERMINVLKLKSTTYNKNYLLFMTLDELHNCEKLIQRLFVNGCSLNQHGNIHPDNLIKYVIMITNLKDEYYRALYNIGYRPTEVLAIYNQNYDELDDIYDQIDCSYNECSWLSCKEYNSILQYGIPSIHNLNDLYSKVIYSLESFVKVLINELRR